MPITWEDKGVDLKAVADELRRLENTVVTVGISSNTSDTELVQYAGAHEFGAEIKRTGKDGKKFTITIPERSWLRGTLDKSSFQDRVAEEFARGFEDIAFNGATARQIGMRIGEVAVGKIRMRIRDNDPPFKPLAESTKRKKTGPGILRESLRMMKAISYAVNGEWFQTNVGLEGSA